MLQGQVDTLVTKYLTWKRRLLATVKSTHRLLVITELA